MRDRLIEIFRKTNYQSRQNGMTSNLATQFTDYALEQIADSLLSEGVIVPNVAKAVDFVEVVRCKDCRFWKEESVENADTHIPLEELWGVKLPIKSVGIGVCECEKFYGECKDERLFLYRALNPLETTKDDFCSFGERSK